MKKPLTEITGIQHAHSPPPSKKNIVPFHTSLRLASPCLHKYLITPVVLSLLYRVRALSLRKLKSYVSTIIQPIDGQVKTQMTWATWTRTNFTCEGKRTVLAVVLNTGHLRMAQGSLKKETPSTHPGQLHQKDRRKGLRCRYCIVRVFQRNQTNSMCVYKERDLF